MLIATKQAQTAANNHVISIPILGIVQMKDGTILGKICSFEKNSTLYININLLIIFFFIFGGKLIMDLWGSKYNLLLKQLYTQVFVLV